MFRHSKILLTTIALSAISLSALSQTVDWANITNKPTYFPVDFAGEDNQNFQIFNPIAFNAGWGNLNDRPSFHQVAETGEFWQLNSIPEWIDNATEGTHHDFMRADGTYGFFLPEVSSPSRVIALDDTDMGFLVSDTQASQVCYEGVMAATSATGVPTAAAIVLEVAETNSTDPLDWSVIAEQQFVDEVSSGTHDLTIPWGMCRMLSPGQYARIRLEVDAGSVTAAINPTQQEALF